jgi:hypothetical protein
LDKHQPKPNKMRIVFLLLMVTLSFVVKSQVKPEGYLGATVTPFFKGGEVGYGGQLGLLFPLKPNGKLGAGFAPTHMNEAKELMVPGFLDLRISATKFLDITLQPGYNFYNNTYSTSYGSYSNTVRSTVQVKGGFTGAAGFTVYGSSKKEKAPRPFFQVKYNYFTFQSSAKTSTTTRTQTSSGTSTRTSNSTSSADSDASAITISFGISFQ